MGNVNRYRYFLSPGNEFSFKPRFIFTDDGLSRIPIPNFDYRELVDALSTPGEYFRHEAFVPGSKYGSITMSFPYTRVFLKYATSERVRFSLLAQLARICSGRPPDRDSSHRLTVKSPETKHLAGVVQR